jgi:hypothetical protein
VFRSGQKKKTFIPTRKLIVGACREIKYSDLCEGVKYSVLCK